MFLIFFFSSRRRHTRCALVTGVQTCALPISLSPLCYRPTPQTNFVFQAGRQVFKLESGVPGLLVRMRRLFPEREILLRSEGTLRFLKISSKVQIGIAAAAVVALMLWAAAAIFMQIGRASCRERGGKYG